MKEFKNILSLNEFLSKYKNENIVNEAFAGKDLERVLDLILNWVIKKTNIVFNYTFHFENIKQDGVVLWGIRFIGKDGSIFRINWASSIPKNTSVMIYSVDFWDKNNLTPTPKYRLVVEDINIVEILAVISSYITSGVNLQNEFYNSFVYADLFVSKDRGEDKVTNDIMKESLSEPEENEFNLLKSKIRLNIKNVSMQDKKRFALLSLKKEGFDGGFEDIFNFEDVGVEENISQEEDVYEQEFEEMLSNQLSMEDKFKDLSFLVTTVANGIRPCFVATGTPGVGKSFTVTKTMESLGLVQDQDWILIKGSTTPFGMYQTFCDYPNGYTIVFDDCDSVFEDKDGIEILKGALDTTPVRNISWKSRNTFSTVGMTRDEVVEKMKSGKYPDNVTISSGVIFLTNILQKNLVTNPKLKAIISRAGNPIDLTFNDDEIFDYIEKLIDKIDILSLDLEFKKEVFEVMKEYHNKGKLKSSLNFRTYINMVKSKYSYDELWYKSQMVGKEFKYSNEEWVRLSVSYS